MERFAGAGESSVDARALDAADGPTRLWVISPCFNRPEDARNLCAALAAVRMPAGMRGAWILVDNASTPALRDVLGDGPLGEPWRCEHLRLPANVGGSGGYNAGMAWALERAGPADLVWLLDSDAVPEPDALLGLVRALDRPRVVAAGSLLRDPQTGAFYEMGGRIDRRTGEYASAWAPGEQRPGGPVDAAYLAACSMLTTAEAIRRAGLMPDTFLHSDDVAFGLRLGRANGGRLVGTPESVVAHPAWDRMRTVARYFAARNSMTALPVAGIGCFRRAMREAARGATLHATGLHALGELHLLGLGHALEGRVMGLPPAGTDFGNPDRPGLTEAEAKADVSGRARVVSARARRGDWFNARGSIAVDAQGGWTLRTGPVVQAWRAAGAMARGFGLAVRLGLGGGAFAHVPPAPACRADRERVRGGEVGLSVVIVAYNREAALLRTLERLARAEPTASAEVIVVDNGSSDGTAKAVAERFPGVRLIELGENTGVAAFNRGVEAAGGRTVLILDDDSWPDATGLGLALLLMEEREDVVGVALHPRHPDGGRSEWPFAQSVEAASDGWPVMGCGNLVRRDAWQRAGGYCETYFLYRNDTDLAMSLGTLGRVWFDPSWVVWHDSPAAARKGVRWCHLATRNWLWMARRHGRGLARVVLGVLGVAQAVRLAGLRPSALVAVGRGVAEGAIGRRPPTDAGNPEGWKALMGLRLGLEKSRAAWAVDRYVGPCATPPRQPDRSTSATSSSASLRTGSST